MTDLSTLDPAAPAVRSARRRVEPGQPFPLGATPDAGGTNFALFSDHAERVTLCLFDPAGGAETERIEVEECTNGVWHVRVPGVGVGAVYGWRVDGPWDPHAGHRFNTNKLLIDPYARDLVGDLVWDDAVYGYTVGAGEEADLVLDGRDSAAFVPKARVVADEAPPRRAAGVPWHKALIYEAHVRGLTMRHPRIPERLRGSFAALGRPEIVGHLRKLGVTVVELMPVHAFAQDRHLVEKGLSNYWGYNTLSFFAPERRYLSSGAREEIRETVDRLHDAGIEVVLDVVYNHTCEGNHLGPTLSWRGIDNRSYYRLMPGDGRHYDDLTGCGNALDTNHPRVLQMVLDSLRHWATVHGVDGFRFDLATTLGRRPDGFDPRHPFFQAIQQDPVLGNLKLIAEPWDVGPGGYQLGNFPAGFSEWNGDYRDVVRDFWAGADGLIGAFASRLAASADLFGEGHRRPWSSVNFVTAHDGYTLHDLVTYQDKHNEANGEDNRDGHSDNRSWNCGVEGETDDPDVLALRARQKRNLIATLFVSQGVPMILAGDEMSNGQGGNNNAYCQDNEIGWVDWRNEDDPDLFEFIGRLSDLRRRRTALARAEFLTGDRGVRGLPEVTWYGSTGARMSADDWTQPHVKCLSVRLSPSRRREPVMLVMLNGAEAGVEFTVPGQPATWRLVVDTAGDVPEGDEVASGDVVVLSGRSLRLYEAAMPTADAAETPSGDDPT
ncbi:glycogen debranching protein GlgX [Oharaeibacter diazotrophicus]|uniref:Glycogen operon protein n=1 Tax=Oharaeibacter diazotrophicus TaxID=1920512 RepID=A0A4R6R8N9_9HYPH|nr:glycogen debranching protein GlgX [Oharaeibacter diazotrophicus]TDP82400.1 glycogen operon protein [Oharaeibacter diazotrophicus]BBE72837.1 glycogen debranching enzyme [Pleomorphomonas sp. SM30]GLS76876.1 glycogen operon protein GlgX homolog [Oharaeibacter diazotrophicus]